MIEINLLEPKAEPMVKGWWSLPFFKHFPRPAGFMVVRLRQDRSHDHYRLVRVYEAYRKN